MPHLARFILIQAPAEAVFAFVADYRNIPRLQPQFQSVRLLSAVAEGVGAVMETRGSFRGLPITTQNTVVTFEPPHLLVSETTGGVRSRSSWRFSADPATPTITRVELTLDYEVAVPELGGLLSGLVQHDVEALTVESLKRLKLLVEGRSPPA